MEVVILIVLLLVAAGMGIGFGVILSRLKTRDNDEILTALAQQSEELKQQTEQVIDAKTGLLSHQVELQNRHTTERLEKLTDEMRTLTEKNYDQQQEMLKMTQESSDRQTRRINEMMDKMLQSNEKKLSDIQQTVDEKLSETLNSRLSASFKTVSEQLENVYKSLGEMQKLSTGVTDSVNGLNRVLTNVKTRGTWAEVQLGNILDQTIPGMYEVNVKTNPKYSGQVEFAVKIPSEQDDSITWLPIDSKFPMEDYARLSAAAEAGDAEGLEAAKKQLYARVRDEAKLVKQYVAPPSTTPFAILYLATEGLYAEIMSSRDGLAEKLQKDGILVAGPSTITALLNSLAMGFRTMAVNKKATEVWKVLGSAKMQYEKFGVLLQKARRKVDEAGKVLEDAEHRNDIIQKNLKKVEALDSPEEAEELLGLPSDMTE